MPSEVCQVGVDYNNDRLIDNFTVVRNVLTVATNAVTCRFIAAKTCTVYRKFLGSASYIVIRMSFIDSYVFHSLQRFALLIIIV